MIKALVAMTGSENNIIWELKGGKAECKQFDISEERKKNLDKAEFFHGGLCFKGVPPFLSAQECKPSVDQETLFN